jgi:LysM repeat protein
MGLALLLSVPFLSLILIRMLWPGSTIWFLIAGILMLGGAAAVFLSRRDAPSYGYQTLSPEPNRLPVVFVGLGVLFLAVLIVPSVSGSYSSPAARLQQSGAPQQASNSQPAVQPTASRQQATTRPQTTPRPTSRPTRAPTAVPTDSSSSNSDQQTASSTPPAGSQTYTVKDGDTLWDIAQQFGVSVDDILAANNLADENALKLGEELIIPPSANATSHGGQANTANEPQATPTE